MEEQNKILPNDWQAPDIAHHTFWIKIISLAVLAVISFTFAWQALLGGLIHGTDLAFWIVPSIAAAFGIGFLTLLAIVNNNHWVFVGTNLFIFLSYVVFSSKDKYALLGGVLFFFISFLFEKRIKSDEKTRADFSLHRIIRSSVNLIVYGLLILLGLNIYVRINQDFQTNPDRFYAQLGHYAARGLEYVPEGLGNYNPNQNFDDFVISQAEHQDPAISSAPAPACNQALNEFKKQLEDRYHIQVSGNPLLGDVVAGVVAEKVKSTSQKYERFFPAIFALIVVALLRTTSFVFIWLTMLVSWAIYRVLLLFKFFRIEKVPVEVNKLQI
jgi:hypothetical protein